MILYATPTIWKTGTDKANVVSVTGGSGDLTVVAASGVSVVINIPSDSGASFIRPPISVDNQKFILKDLTFTNTTSKVASITRGGATGPFYTRFENVTVDMNNVNAFMYNADDISNNVNIELYRCTVSNIGYGVWKNPKVSGSKMVVNIQSSLFNHVAQLQYSSVDSSVDLTMLNNTIVKSTLSPFLAVKGTGNVIVAKNNIFVANSTVSKILSMADASASDFIANPSNYTFKNNVVYHETIADSTSLNYIGISNNSVELLPLDESNLYLNPNFVNTASDFHISASLPSYIAGRGDVSALPLLDRDGNAWTGADVGCYANPTSDTSTPALTREVAFVGDSIMAGVFTFEQYTPPAGWSLVGNTPEVEWTPSESRAAIGGLKVNGVRWLVDRVMVDEKPKVVYLSIGVNNGSPYMGSASPTNLTAQQLAASAVTAMKKVQRWGGIPIWLGVMPQSGSNLELQVQFADEVNALMATTCATNGWRHGAILDYFRAKNANWNTVYYDDIATNVHPNATGQGIIAELALNLHPKRNFIGGFGNMNFNFGW